MRSFVPVVCKKLKARGRQIKPFKILKLLYDLEEAVVIASLEQAIY